MIFIDFARPRTLQILLTVHSGAYTGFRRDSLVTFLSVLRLEIRQHDHFNGRLAYTKHAQPLFADKNGNATLRALE